MFKPLVEAVVIFFGNPGFLSYYLFSSDNHLDFVLLAILWKSDSLTNFSNHIITFVSIINFAFIQNILVCDGHNLVEWIFSFLTSYLHKNTPFPITGIIGMLVHLCLVNGTFHVQRRTPYILPDKLSILFAVDQVFYVE